MSRPGARALFVMLLCSIWQQRNYQLWNSIENTALELIVELSLSSVSHNAATLSAGVYHETWLKLPTGFMKCNVDADIFSYNANSSYN